MITAFQLRRSASGCLAEIYHGEASSQLQMEGITESLSCIFLPVVDHGPSFTAPSQTEDAKVPSPVLDLDRRLEP